MYKLNDAKMFYDEADGIGIIIDFTSGIYFSLNKVGTAIYNALTAGGSSEAIIAELRKLENCSDKIDEYVNDFVSTLETKEILLKNDEDYTVVVPFSQEVIDEGCVPSCDEFSEVQDLILADPVHDVDPNMGWPVMKDDKE